MKKINIYVLFLVLLFLSYLVFLKLDTNFISDNTSKIKENKVSLFKKFSSANEFSNYLKKSSTNADESFNSTFLRGVEEEKIINFSATSDSRFSNTNIQVKNIDEPDIVKTDGENIFLSKQNFYRLFDASSFKRGPYYELPKNEVSIIDATFSDKLELKSKIKEAGDLLLRNNILSVFSYNKIISYDVSDNEKPKRIWDISLEKGVFYKEARLYNNKIYLLTTKNNLDYTSPCPVSILRVNEEKISIPCSDIFYYKDSANNKVFYTVSVINQKNGEIENKISFLGSYNSVLYMSENYIYMTYVNNKNATEFFMNFVIENSDLFDDVLISKVKNLLKYDISINAKQIEFSYILSNFKNRLNKDKLSDIQSKIESRLDSYVAKNKEKLQTTSIVKIDNKNLSINSVGIVPGSVLNQFSIDEYKGELRIATTIGLNIFGFNMINMRNKSVNDVYILNDKLDKLGYVSNLGIGERIYSVRFIGDKAYVVTFRQTDPFYVLDLSSSKNPKKIGELKIPGYSSYLHPLSDNIILGIGKEKSNVKISVFDVSDNKRPKEISKYILNEYWSDILKTHKAFLTDKKFEAFFIPGSKGAYIFSFKNNLLKLEKEIKNIRAKRFIFINNNLYIIGDSKIIILDEYNWEEKGEFYLK